MPAGADGLVKPEAVVKAVREDTVLVSVMLVNNETGAVQPVGEICEAVRRYEMEKALRRKIHIHSDCVQAYGKIPVNVFTGIDSISARAQDTRAKRNRLSLCESTFRNSLQRRRQGG